MDEKLPASDGEDLTLKDEFLQNYSLLKSLGVLDRLESLKKEKKDLEDLLTQAGRIFLQQNLAGMAQLITNLLIDKFIPSYLAFILQEDLASEKPAVMTYRNLQPTANLVQVPSMAPYKQFFSLSPVSVTFRVFEYMVGRENLTDIFKPLNPEKVVPIMGFDGVHGFVIIGTKMLGGEYTEAETSYLDRLIQLVSISFQNSIHYKRAVTDIKTKLYNHAFFMTRLEEEFLRVKRYKGELGMIMVDVDHFKVFNDSYGHLAGDQVLVELAKVIRTQIRNEDIAARFGGEEFSILLIQCGPEMAYQIAERIRLAVEGHRVDFQGQELKITISLGVACACHTHMPGDLNRLIHQADQALYQSKKNGRNRATLTAYCVD